MSSSSLVLFTGKGGVGKTTNAAAAAAHCAAAGHKTIVVSADPAHSLADVLNVPLGAEPTLVGESLFAAHLDGTAEFHRAWGKIRAYLGSILTASGLNEVTSAQVLTPPGAAELGALVALNALVESATYEVIVVDCAPTSETLRLLALPTALDWFLARASPGSILKSLWQRGTGIPLPGSEVLSALDELRGSLGAVETMLRAPSASVRLVSGLERVVIAETRRLYTTLTVLGYHVDGVVANRVMSFGEQKWPTEWARAHQAAMSELRDSFPNYPVWTVPFLSHEPIGREALAEVGAASYGELAVIGQKRAEPMVVTADSLTLPTGFADDAQLRVAMAGTDLVVTVDGHRRLIALPEVLSGRPVRQARLRDGELRLSFGSASTAQPERI